MEKQEEKKVESPRTVLLEQLGANLPLGIKADSGNYLKSFSVNPWTMKQEKELGKIAEENKDVNMATYVSMVLSHMCSKIGPYDFTTMDDAAKLVRLSQMFMGDIFYIYCWLRKQSLGHLLPLELKCPSCKKDFPFKADLNTIEVKIADNLDDVLWEYKLQNPIKIKEKVVTTLTIGPPRWNTMEMIDSNINMGTAKESMIIGSIHSVKEVGPTVIVPGELDELTKVDFETLITKIDDSTLGPDMSIKDKCPVGNCKHNFVMPIDWKYDSFFGVSSSQLKD